jgi:RNA-directed DNA polymerase
MNTATRPMYEWNMINWKKIQRNVFKLQKRIYQASQRGDVTSMRKLQKLLLKSNAAKLLAIRKVTQDNQGKKTAGVDGIRKLSPVQRMKLSKLNLLEAKVKPTRRIWIPKPNSNEKRPLGIPVIFTNRSINCCLLWCLKFLAAMSITRLRS